VLDFFTERPHAHLADATAAIWERFDVNLSAKSVANILYKNRWSRKGKRGSNSTALQGPGAVRNVPSSTQRQNETSNVASTTAVPHAQVQEETFDFVPQPMESPSPELPLAPSPVVLPEISLPAFYLQSAVEPASDHNQPAIARPNQRIPCPTRGCSSREHQNA